ncbi:MAG: hypothetical protein KF773_33935 [Deltaproteobacteria bacterium]|nr:hypothetical protein [Deltaproteobacteria bacterium]MCW5809287.1 hypothetical protein [Deltaproteobacteria bacterium]
MLKIDRNAFLALALGMNLAACFSGGKAGGPATTGPGVTDTHSGKRMPPPSGEAGMMAPHGECVEFDPSGECTRWEPTQECVEFDPSGECTKWEPHGE